MKRKIFYDEIKFRLDNSKKTIILIEKVIRNEKKIPGDLSFIFTSDEKIIKINREFLKHNYFTDVIAFDYSQGKILNGEIYISAETVKRNAHNYNVSLNEEMKRVMIHGTLHLCGYDDTTKDQKERMRLLEDKWLGK